MRRARIQNEFCPLIDLIVGTRKLSGNLPVEGCHEVVMSSHIVDEGVRGAAESCSRREETLGGCLGNFRALPLEPKALPLGWVIVAFQAQDKRANQR